MTTIDFNTTQDDASTHAIEDGQVRYFFAWPEGATAEAVASAFLADYYTEEKTPAPVAGSIETLAGQRIASYRGVPGGLPTVRA